MNYQLHDYAMDSVILDNDKIIFSFPNGFYVTDDNGVKLTPVRKKLVFKVDGDDPEQCLFIRRRGILGWRDISFKEFSGLFKKGNMLVYDEYDSKLTNWKMIQLNANTRWSNIEMFITEIEAVECME